MLIAKRIGLFLFLYFGLLILGHVAPVKSLISKTYNAIGNMATGSYRDGGTAKFRSLRPEELGRFKGFDSLVQLSSERQQEIAIEKAKAEGRNSAQISPVTYPVNSWVKLGMILSFFLALCLSTPISIKRKLIALALGCLSIFALVALQSFTAVGTKFARYYGELQAGFSDPMAVSAIRRVDNIIQYMGFSLLFAFIVWAVLCLPHINYHKYSKAKSS